MPAHIRKEDFVEVISGKDRGRSGKVLKVFPKDGMCIVEKVNVVKRHQKTKGPQGGPSGIIEKSMKIPLCKVMLLDPKTKKVSRVRIEQKAGKSIRVFTKTSAPVDAA